MYPSSIFWQIVKSVIKPGTGIDNVLPADFVRDIIQQHEQHNEIQSPIVECTIPLP